MGTLGTRSHGGGTLHYMNHIVDRVPLWSSVSVVLNRLLRSGWEVHESQVQPIFRSPRCLLFPRKDGSVSPSCGTFTVNLSQNVLFLLKTVPVRYGTLLPDGTISYV